jgi:hypothetical protein
MATDEPAGGVLLFGGSSRDELTTIVTYSDDTWLWNGLTWRRLSLLYSPPARSSAVLEPLGDGSILLFGGSGPANTD